MLRIDFVTLFPEMVMAAVDHSMMRRATNSGQVRFGATNPRDFCYDRHQKVDDAPFGGAAGMLICAEPVALALEALGIQSGSHDEGTAVIVLDPTGETFDQRMAHELSAKARIVLVCGHYEGIDQRVFDTFDARTVSLGDYIVTNGELPALLLADAVVRLLPGVLGSADSLCSDSFADGLLSAPNYTRPKVWRGIPIPDVLDSGDHGAIRKWRRTEALRATKRYRPDLLARAKLDKADLDVLSS